MPSVLPAEGVSVDSELRTILCHALLWASERLSRLPTGGSRLSAAAELVGFEKLPRTPGDPTLQFSCRKIRAAFFAAAWSSFCPSVKDLKVRPIGGFYTAATSPLIAVHLIASFASALVFFFSFLFGPFLGAKAFKSSLHSHSKCFPKASVSIGRTSLKTFRSLFVPLVHLLSAEEPPNLWRATVRNQTQLRG